MSGCTVGGRGIPAIGNPGRAACELPAGEPPATPMVADHALAEFATSELEIRAASIRGLMHRYRAQPRQDAFSVVHEQSSNTTLVVVCDGVGSLPRSHEAAALVVDRLPGHFWTHRDWTAAVKAVNEELQEIAEHVMATTVVAAAITPGPAGWRLQIVRSDDSTVWALSPDGTWSPVSADAGADTAVHTGSVRALPAATPKLHETDTVLDGIALFVMTDGVDGPLRDAPEVRETLADWWSSPPTVFDFGSQVGFARKTHMDDRTVVGIWPTARDKDRQ
ncbi:MAG TPA: protein phosphatase 2C domain-containing protein [Pseudonocardiaceae bacterium]|nr:protein phosphatase 2C domain-containing protein [Pseudonocardiaceae bacterium]